MFWIIYLFLCGLVIAVFLWLHYKKKKITCKQETIHAQTKRGDNNKTKEDLQHTFDTVNSWLNNCDQKAGILLAAIGVAVTIIMTGDFLKFLREYIFGPFVQYCGGQSDLTFSWGRFTVFCLLIIAVSILIVSCCYLFGAIRANIDYDKMYKDNPGLVKKSYVFFGTISKMRFYDFKKEECDYEEDLKSQIYVNSIIATKKFQNYNEGLFWFKLLLLVAAMLFVAVLFMQ